MQPAGDAKDAPRLPALRTRRMLLIVTGSVSAAYLPSQLMWLRTRYRELETQVVLTRSAGRFVSKEALGHIAGRAVRDDAWAEDAETPLAEHVDWWMWADSVVVYPATMNFISRLALGVSDTPSLLTLHCTEVPIVVAPALPPGGWQSETMTRHVASLRSRSNVVVVPPVPGLSFATGERDGWSAAPLRVVLRELVAGDAGASEQQRVDGHGEGKTSP